MKTERYKKIMEDLGMPESQSLKIALEQVANETAQEVHKENGGTMKIKKIIFQAGRDYEAIYECEHCGHEQKSPGYEGAIFCTKVIPGMRCLRCGKPVDEDDSLETAN